MGEIPTFPRDNSKSLMINHRYANILSVYMWFNSLSIRKTLNNMAKTILGFTSSQSSVITDLIISSFHIANEQTKHLKFHYGDIVTICIKLIPCNIIFLLFMTVMAVDIHLNDVIGSWSLFEAFIWKCKFRKKLSTSRSMKNHLPRQ